MASQAVVRVQMLLYFLMPLITGVRPRPLSCMVKFRMRSDQSQFLSNQLSVWYVFANNVELLLNLSCSCWDAV